jgi:hypothetical protein
MYRLNIRIIYRNAGTMGAVGAIAHKINTVKAEPPRLHGLFIFTFSP